jgi:predicted transcriptional regulator/DNA-binding XRE family transcriptional regulator
MSKLKGEIIRAVRASDSDTGRIIGRSLKSLRELAGLTQAGLAERLRVGRSAVSAMENCADVQISTLRQYVAALGGTLRVDAVFDRSALVSLPIDDAFESELEDVDQLILPLFEDSLFKSSRDVVLSVKPHYSKKIVTGMNTVELRRRFPMSPPRGTIAYIYSTSPDRAMIGSAKIASIQKLPVKDIWKRFGKVAHIERKDFENYFSGLKEGFAISFAGAQRFNRPLDLAELRERFGFEPPQSFLYATPLLRTALQNEYANVPD